jgi:hypothetical protein
LQGVRLGDDPRLGQDVAVDGLGVVQHLDDLDLDLDVVGQRMEELTGSAFGQSVPARLDLARPQRLGALADPLQPDPLVKGPDRLAQPTPFGESPLGVRVLVSAFALAGVDGIDLDGVAGLLELIPADRGEDQDCLIPCVVGREVEAHRALGRGRRPRRRVVVEARGVASS